MPPRLSRRRFCAASSGIVMLSAMGAEARRALSVSAGARGRQETASLAAAPLRVVTVQAALDHPQGLEVDATGETWWISAVHRQRRAGLLAAVDARTGATRRLVEIQDGDCYHPGGLSRLGESLWVPVAEYRRDSRTIVQRRDAATLSPQTAFEVADHIGCLAASRTVLVGANWDARRFYAWAPDGREVARRDNPTAARYQDLKWLDGRLVAGGLLGETGVVDVLAWPSLRLEHRLEVGRTDRGVVLTHEGLAIEPDRLLLMPEDDPVRVFVYPRPAGL